jgi:hypothetical protein
MIPTRGYSNKSRILRGFGQLYNLFKPGISTEENSIICKPTALEKEEITAALAQTPRTDMSEVHK